jgi:hypothetical protein
VNRPAHIEKYLKDHPMKTWRVLRKEARRDPGGGSMLILHVIDKLGREQQAVVSGYTFDRAKDDTDVELSLE